MCTLRPLLSLSGTRTKRSSRLLQDFGCSLSSKEEHNHWDLYWWQEKDERCQCGSDESIPEFGKAGNHLHLVRRSSTRHLSPRVAYSFPRRRVLRKSYGVSSATFIDSRAWLERCGASARRLESRAGNRRVRPALGWSCKRSHSTST